MAKTKRGRDINAILLLDKPTGWTSNDALQKVKRLYNANKAGHTGSLDPLATGMLPICFGEATKFSRFLLEADKEYLVEAKLGISTNTGDADGEVVATKPVPTLDQATLEKVLEQFRGDIQQIPSMFSAIKYQGKPLYEYARKGIEVERHPRPVTISSLDLLKIEDDVLTLFVHASKGTYIRTLVQDIGEALGCGAHVTALRREMVAGFKRDMVTMDKLIALSEQEDATALDERLLPIEIMLENLPELEVSEAAVFYLKQGQAVILPHALTEGMLRLKLRGDQFVGLGEILSDGRVAPKKIIQAVSR